MPLTSPMAHIAIMQVTLAKSFADADGSRDDNLEVNIPTSFM